MRVDQVVVSAAPGDAITSVAQSLRRLLSAHYGSDIFARYYHDDLQHEVRPLTEYASRSGAQAQDLLLYHVSIGDADVDDLILGRPERLVVIYHNISPSEPFRPYDPGFADLLDQGRAGLQRLQRRAMAALADSEFNAAELRALGFRDVAVLPLLHRVGDLLQTPADAAFCERLAAQPDGPIILAISQLLPHKRIDFLIEAFHIFSTYRLPNARLIVVGAPRIPGYAAALQIQIDELHLEQAWLAGSVSQSMLVAALRKADLFVTGSEHEGFCAPLLEAMAFDLPFQARRFGAVAETAGHAGLILDPDDGPAVAAEAWTMMVTDSSLRRDLIARGRNRLADFDIDKIEEVWRQALTALV